jgi:hypothetical protein
VTYKSTYDVYLENIEAAREAVGKAQLDYSKGGGTAALNRAYRELQNAHEAAERCYSGRAPDTRQRGRG